MYKYPAQTKEHHQFDLGVQHQQMNRYDQLFNSRTQQRGGNVGPLYKIRLHRQGGQGFSQAFRSLWSLIQPFLLSSGKVLSKQALESGSEILGNLGKRPIKELLKEQGKKTAQSLFDHAEDKLKLMRQQRGSGHKRRRRQLSTVIKGLTAARVTRKRAKRSRKTTKRRSKKPVKRNLFL